MRTHNKDILKNCEIWVGVGGEFNIERNHFDSHIPGFKEAFSSHYSTPLSCCGMIYKLYGRDVIEALLDINILPHDLEVLYEIV